MYYRKLVSLAVALVLALSAVWVASATPKNSEENNQRRLQGVEPLNLAILIQDDLVPQVANEIGVTRDFIRSLPQGSQVMVGYITAGTLQVRQPFTTDLEKAARSLRIPLASTASSPFNPYVEVIEALKKFDSNGTNANATTSQGETDMGGGSHGRYRPSNQGSKQAARGRVQFLRSFGWLDEPQPHRRELRTEFLEPFVA